MRENRIPYLFDEIEAVDELEHCLSNIPYEEYPEDAARKVFLFLKDKKYINI